MKRHICHLSGTKTACDCERKPKLKKLTPNEDRLRKTLVAKTLGQCHVEEKNGEEKKALSADSFKLETDLQEITRQTAMLLCDIEPQLQLGTGQITALPDELLLNIMGWLPKCELLNAAKVCQRWSDVSRDFSLWRTVHATGMTLSSEQLCTVLSEQPRLQTLTLTGREDCNAILGQLCRSNRTLVSLTVMGSRGSRLRKNIVSKTMVKVLKSCSGLKELVMEGASFRSCDFYRYLLGDMQGRLRHLRLTVNPSRREWECLCLAQRRKQLIMHDAPPQPPQPPI